MHRKFLVKKALLMTIIILFSGISTISIAGDIKTEEYLKDYNISDSIQPLENKLSDCNPFFVGQKGNNSWFINDVMIYFIFHPERVKTIWYRITSEDWIEYGFKEFYFRQEGFYEFDYYWEDFNNNTFYPSTAESVKIDKTLPTIQLNSQVTGLKKNKIKFTAKVNDGEKGSGIDKVEFYLDGELEETVKNSPYEYIYKGGEEGVSVSAIVYDLAGHTNTDEEITTSLSFREIYLGKFLQRLSAINQIIIHLIRFIYPFPW